MAGRRSRRRRVLRCPMSYGYFRRRRRRELIEEVKLKELESYCARKDPPGRSDLRLFDATSSRSPRPVAVYFTQGKHQGYESVHRESYSQESNAIPGPLRGIHTDVL